MEYKLKYTHAYLLLLSWPYFHPDAANIGIELFINAGARLNFLTLALNGNRLDCAAKYSTDGSSARCATLRYKRYEINENI